MKVERLNPSLKVFTILISVILLSVVYKIRLNLLVFGSCMILLLFFSDAKLKYIVGILIPAFLAALGLFMMGLYYARGNDIGSIIAESSKASGNLNGISVVPYAVRAALSTNLDTALQLSTRLLAFAGFGALFALTTDGEAFVSSLMHQCHLKPKFAYGILAAVHLMPDMIREYSNVRLAFKVRGIHVRTCSLKPVFSMLVNSIRWSESVAMAMESKGFCGEEPRTYCEIPRVTWVDWFFAGGTIGLLIIGMILL